MTTAEENIVQMRRAVAAWNTGDRQTLGQLLAPEFVDHLGPGTSRDRSTYLQFFDAMRAAFPDLQLAEELLLAAGDHVTLRFILTGTHQGAFLGVAPTGKAVTVTGIGVVRLADGLMVERWQNMDSLGLLQQLGATIVAPGASAPAC